MLNLAANGIRLRFDGPEQRLRLIEVLDFTKNHIVFKEQNKDRDLVRPASQTSGPASQQGEPSLGPTFRHIYTRFLGPTYDGEYIPNADGEQEEDTGTYVLSYPGVAFTFPMARSAYGPDKDVVSLLSASSSQIAVSMAVFSGESWAQARQQLWTEVLPSVKAFSPLAKGKDVCPDEVSLVKIYGGGKLQLLKRWANSAVWISLGETTPQELVAELGPPDAIYRKNDQRMYIHKIRTASSSRTRPNGVDFKRQDDLTDTDQSSAHTASDDDSNDEAIEDEFVGNVSGECFYNYFYLGFDVLVSTPVPPSRPPLLQDWHELVPNPPLQEQSPDRLVATKFILHGNVPGSYPFNRHRRCRWEIAYLDSDAPADSETPFAQVEEGLHEAWRALYGPEDESKPRQRGMVLNRGWGDSPGSSCELLGGWEGDVGAAGRGVKGSEDSTTTLYGFPGLVFEVLRNGFVSALTIF